MMARQVPTAAPRTRRAAISLRVVVPLGAAIILILVTMLAAEVQQREARAILMREIQTRLELEARHLADASAVILMEPLPELRLQPLIHSILRERPDLGNVIVLDNARTIVGSSVAKDLGRVYGYAADLRPVPRQTSDYRLLENRELLVAAAPVARVGGGTLGFTVIEMRKKSIDDALAKAHVRLRLVVAVTLPVAVLVTLLLTSYLLRNLSRLRAGLERIAAGNLETVLELRDGTELGLLADTVNDMAHALRVAQRDALERERLRGELEVAARIQQTLLPTGYLQTSRALAEGIQRPATEVGGDYYDIFELADGRIGLVVADVAGKGVGGCLVTAMLYSLLRAYREIARSPAELLQILDRDLGSMLQRHTFVTMWYGVLDPASGRLEHASAGHLPLLVYRAGTRSIEWCRSRAVPLGAIGGGVAQRMLGNDVLELEPGDMVVQYTDGFTEAMEPSRDEQFGLDRLGAVVRDQSAGDPRGVLDALSAAVAAWTGRAVPADDQTAIVVCHAPVVAAAAVVPAGPPVEGADAWAGLLRRARSEGSHLKVEATSKALDGLSGWLQSQPTLGVIPGEKLQVVETALYELCMNILEHGYAGRANKEAIDLWWVPGEAEAHTTAGPPSRGGERGREGYFLLRDDGTPFDPSGSRLPDLGDPRVRRRGRGFGLAMVRKLMPEARFYPATAEGNITVLWLSTTRAKRPGEVQSDESIAPNR